MKVIIVNWNHGENDPFSVLNQAIEKYFIACGKSVEILEISDDRFMNRLLDWVPDAANRDKVLAHNPARLYGF